MNFRSKANGSQMKAVTKTSCCVILACIAIVAHSETDATVSNSTPEKNVAAVSDEHHHEARNVELDKPILPKQVLPSENKRPVVAKPAELKAVIKLEEKELELTGSGDERYSAQQKLEQEQKEQSLDESDNVSAQPAIEQAEQIEGPEPFILLDTEIPPATATRLAWTPDQSFKGIAVPTPVLVVNGVEPGPVVCLTAAIHGDELNGIEIVRRVLYELEPEELSGTVIGVPIVNLQGFHRSSRYLTDRRDLNRFFPGNPYGSSASRLAYSFFNEVILHCDALIDLHTGSFHRTNLPQLRVNTHNEQVLALAKSFGATVIVHGEGALGTLRRSAVDAGIPAVTLEAGESMRLQEQAVAHGVKGIETLLEQKSMLSSMKFWKTTEAIYYQTIWMRADQGGILFSRVELGDDVKIGDVLGVVTDPITNISSDIIAHYDGRVIGMGLNQVVMPGFATFHIGIDPEANEIVSTQTLPEDPLPEIPGVQDPGLMDTAVDDTEDFN